jgi:hypothetical protein
MTTWFKDGKQLPERSLEIIESMFHRVNHPLFLGIVALEVRWNLQRTQEMFDVLEDRGVIRPATAEEKKQHGLAIDAHIYVLVAERSLAKAHPSW